MIGTARERTTSSSTASPSAWHRRARAAACGAMFAVASFAAAAAGPEGPAYVRQRAGNPRDTKPAASSPATAAKPVPVDEQKPLTRLSGSLPVFPPEARQRGIGGVVTMEVTIDPAGKVSGLKVVRSIPTFEAAAADAVRKWTFEAPKPLANGANPPRIQRVVFYFDVASARVEEAQRIPAQAPQPRKTKTVAPVAPAGAASHDNRPTVVTLEAVVDRLGKVVDVRALSGPTSYQNAARDAVRQYEYEPLVANGNAIPFVLTVTVLFH